MLCDLEQPYVWARNLYILRSVDCPIVMLEPYLRILPPAMREFRRAWQRVLPIRIRWLVIC